MQAQRMRTAMAAMAVATALVVAGCGSSDGDKASSTKETTTTVADSTTTSTDDEATTTTEADDTTTTAAPGDSTTTTEDNSGDPGKEGTETGSLDTLPTGMHYGYFAGVEEGKVEGQDVQVLLWDEVEFLTGQDAIDAAKEHNDEVDNDYYIVNDNEHLRRLAIVPDAQVYSLQGGTPDTIPSSPDEVSKQPYLFKIETQNVRGITTITSVEGVYLP